MRKDPDLIFLLDHMDEWYTDYNSPQEDMIARENASEEVKAALKRVTDTMKADAKKGIQRY